VLAKIEWDQIGELLWAAPLSALAVSLSFSLLILGSARATDARREGAGGVATLYGALALVAGVAFCAAVVYGISIITTK
jgi:hypothetical protein